MAQEPLDAGDPSFDPLICLHRPPEQSQLTPFVRHHFAGGEPYERYAGARRIDGSSEPSLELPPHPVHHRPGGEGPVRPPPPAQLLTVLCRGLD